MNLKLEKDTAVRAAIKAGSFIRHRAGSLDTGEVREKGAHDLVTVVDETSERLIIECLSHRFPGDAFLAEEGTAASGESPSNSPRRWIIDPVDGTTNFTHNQSPYCVSIGLEIEGEVHVGVIYEVSRDELFVAVRGEGAYVNGRPIHVSVESDLDKSLVTTGFPFREYSQIDAYMLSLRRFMHSARAVRRPGSAAADLAYVAAGRMDGFFEVGLSAWDVAAGALLVEEAGGVVSDFGGGNDYLFGRKILASNGRIHHAMQEILVPLRDEPNGDSMVA